MVACVIPRVDVGAFLAIVAHFCKQERLARVRLFPVLDLLTDLRPGLAKLFEGWIHGFAEFVIVADADQIERIPKGDGFVVIPVGGVDQVSVVDLADGANQLEPSGAMGFHADEFTANGKQFDAVLLGDVGVMEDITAVALPPRIEVFGFDDAAPVFGAALSEADDGEEKDLESASSGLVDGADQACIADGLGFVTADVCGAYVFLIPTDDEADVASACIGDICEKAFVVVGLILEVKSEADTAKEGMSVSFAPIG